MKKSQQFSVTRFPLPDAPLPRDASHSTTDSGDFAAGDERERLNIPSMALWFLGGSNNAVSDEKFIEALVMLLSVTGQRKTQCAPGMRRHLPACLVLQAASNSQALELTAMSRKGKLYCSTSPAGELLLQ